MVTARFEGDISRRTNGSGRRRLQRMNFGMRLARAQMPALANDDAVANENTANTGIGGGRKKTTLSQLQGARHEFVIGGAEHQC